MDRLTKRAKNGLAYLEIPLNQSSVIDKDGYIVGCCTGFIADRLAEYEDLEEQGLLIKLPCKVGQPLFTYSHIRGCVKEFIAPDKTWIFENTMLFGKEIFLTREEAEKALEEFK